MFRFKPPDGHVPRIDVDPLCAHIDYACLLESHGIRCKGGGGGGVDTAYNDRMATIYETQNEWAVKFNQFWETHEQPYEIAKINANMKQLEEDEIMRPFDLALRQGQHEVDRRRQIYDAAEAEEKAKLLWYQSENARESLITDTERQKAIRPVQDKFFSEAMNGVDANSWASQAQADAARAFMSSQTASEMAMARRGAVPGSGAYAGQSNEGAFARATALGQAATAGRESGERESFSRLSGAMAMA